MEKNKNLNKFFVTKSYFYYVGLLLLFGFHFINNLFVVLKDTTPFMADASDYYIMSFYSWKTFISFVKHGDFHLLDSIFHTGLGGQLLTFLTIPFYSIFGVSHDIAIIANQSLFLILILSIFGIGKILFNRNVGLLAAFAISFYPSVFGFSRVYILTFPILAISALCVYLLIKSDGFKNLKYSIYLGFAFALGELLRPRFVIYIIFPVLYYMIKNIVILCNSQTEVPIKLLVKKIMINIFSSAVFSYILLFPWYSLDNISKYLNNQSLWPSPHFSKINSTFLYYLGILFKIQLRWFFASLFLVGLFMSLFDQDKKKKIYFLLVWFVFPLTLLSSFGLKDLSQLIIPLCVPIALISAVGLERLLRQKHGKYALFILLSFIITQYFFISYDKMAYSLNRAYWRGYFERIVLSQGLLHANNGDWKIDEITSTFNTRRNFDKEFNWKIDTLGNFKGFHISDNSEDFIKILFIEFSGSPIINAVGEKIFFKSLPITYFSLYPEYFDYKRLLSDIDFQHIVLGADYIVKFKVGPDGSEFAAKILNIFDENISKFEKLKSIETPWGECLIYGRKVEKI